MFLLPVAVDPLALSPLALDPLALSPLALSPIIEVFGVAEFVIMFK